MLSAIKYWIWLTTVLEPPAAWLVYNHFGSPEDAYFADHSSYNFIEGLTPPQHTALKEKDLGRAEEILEDCAPKGHPSHYLAGRRLPGAAAQHPRSAVDPLSARKTLPF